MQTGEISTQNSLEKQSAIDWIHSFQTLNKIRFCPLIHEWWQIAPHYIHLSKWPPNVSSPDLYLYSLMWKKHTRRWSKCAQRNTNRQLLQRLTWHSCGVGLFREHIFPLCLQSTIRILCVLCSRAFFFVWLWRKRSRHCWEYVGCTWPCGSIGGVVWLF